MPDTKYPSGSEWRKWDLHIHTASSYDYDYKSSDADEKLVTCLSNNCIAAIAITDHHLIDVNRIKNIKSLIENKKLGITVFPGIELRTDKGNGRIHIIVIFPEGTDTVFLETNFNSFKSNKGNLGTKRDENEELFFKLDDVLEWLADLSTRSQLDSIITVHAGNKDNGIGKELVSCLSVSDAIKTDIASNIHIFEVSSKKDEQEYKKKVIPELAKIKIPQKAIILCSDNHDPRDDAKQNEIGGRFTWIKSDTTFEGLRQALCHTDERIYIGDKPEKLVVSEKDKTLYIKSISCQRIDSPNNKDVKWFDFNIPLNLGLTAIIGNKGSGKSALSDIIGHTCKCFGTMGEASFLNSERFRKPPENYAKDYCSTITWADGKQEIINLEVSSYGTSLENAQYLPQKYIERLCTELMAEKFQEQINDLILSHIAESEKGSASTLGEYTDGKIIAQKEDIKKLKDELTIVNDKIIECEKYLKTEYISENSEKIAKIEDTLKRLEEDLSSTPKVAATNSSSKEIEQINEIDSKITKIQQDINSINVQILDVNKHIEELVKLQVEIKNIVDNLARTNEKVSTYNSKYQNKLIRSIELKNSPAEDIVHHLSELNKTKKDLEKKLGIEFLPNNGSLDENLQTHKDTFHGQLYIMQIEKNKLLSSLDSKNKEYQMYVKTIDEKKKNIESIKGSKDKPETLEYLKQEKINIETVMPNKYSEFKTKRIQIISDIITKKQEIVDKYSELYQPVKEKLKDFLRDMNMSFEAAMQIAGSIVGDNNRASRLEEKLLSFIHQGKESEFYGKAPGLEKMRTYIKNINFSDASTISHFVNNILEIMHKNQDAILDKKNFYNYIAALDYISIDYKLTMNDISLRELSPGERGIVLLIFYLSLSKKNIPLVIDQPEDNLDNETIFTKLVNCIRETKAKRQIIIVTHNPNIAIACDAEQIICSKVDKVNKHIMYEYGSIENPAIKKQVVNVLEGTKDAFKLRGVKYEPELK
ncbi:MAG: hypothetical protein PHR82_05720 [Endomicrobiaceae bacterium]|nr:hypothetical protein [Endomicrobiaceae bacterium]